MNPWKWLRSILLASFLCSTVVVSIGGVQVWRAEGPDTWNPAEVFTTPELRRFYTLPEQALRAAGEEDWEQARAGALDLLDLAERFPNNWNHGNAIHDANVVLGLAALASDDLGEAREALLRAGATPGSPQLDTYGPDMRLAEALSQRGEHETVLAYFELCRRFWAGENGRLDRWAESASRGEVPRFGPHAGR